MIKAEWAKILDGAGFQAAAICVCIVCIYYLMVKTKPEKFRNKLFLILVLNVLIGALCNFISAILKSYLNVSDAAYNVRMICQYIYFIIHPMLAPLFCFYVSIVTGANYKLKKYRLISEIPAAFMFLLALINPITNSGFIILLKTENFIEIGQKIFFMG
ncbi:MAG: hypothetical protein IJ141_04280 [Lachnospiraceae bacterium]|nr:hypothetical protein [Lachnospiraceae bacterium]